MVLFGLPTKVRSCLVLLFLRHYLLWEIYFMPLERSEGKWLRSLLIVAWVCRSFITVSYIFIILLLRFMLLSSRACVGGFCETHHVYNESTESNLLRIGANATFFRTVCSRFVRFWNLIIMTIFASDTFKRCAHFKSQSKTN